MKVLCIDGIKVGHIGSNIYNTRFVSCTTRDVVIEGEVYNVAGVEEYNGITYYVLQERTWLNLYNSRRFVPLSDINESELVNTKEELHA